MIGSIALTGMGSMETIGMMGGAYVAIFALSAGFRAMAFFACTTVRDEVAHAVPIAMQTLSLRPSAGSFDVPEPASIEEAEAMSSS
jgi:hypothetical protein